MSTWWSEKAKYYTTDLEEFIVYNLRTKKHYNYYKANLLLPIGSGRGAGGHCLSAREDFPKDTPQSSLGCALSFSSIYWIVTFPA